MTLYRLYIDEVGNHDLKHVDDPNQRFLSLTGVIIETEYLRQVIKPEMNRIKKAFFKSDPDETVIFHRREIIKKKGCFNVLWNKDIESDFNNKLLNILKEWNYNVITVVIDKKEHKEKYLVWRYDPYHYCFEIILERFIIFLQSESAKGDVMVESRGGKEDKKLCKSYETFYKHGTNYINKQSFQEQLTSKSLKVKPKWKNICGLQIADLIAYPSQKEILIENDLIIEKKVTFGNKICDILNKGKFLRNKETGLIQGYGKKLLP